MRRVLKWLGYFVVALAVLALCGAVAVYAVSEYELRKSRDAPSADISMPRDAKAIEEGKRLARVYGCFEGCHADLKGSVLLEVGLSQLVAPNLTEAAKRYTADELARIVRFGVRPDGTTTTGMPTDSFYYLSDRDLARIIAFLQSAEPVPSDLPDTSYGPLIRWNIARTAINGDSFGDAEETALRGPRPPVPERAPTPQYGRYLAITACSHCHGMRLQGFRAGEAPPLSVVKGYSREDFGRLMKTGVAAGQRELGMMAEMSRLHFRHLKEQEVDALYAFLQSAPLPLDDG